jgi:hypothetical protein
VHTTGENRVLAGAANYVGVLLCNVPHGDCALETKLTPPLGEAAPAVTAQFDYVRIYAP